MYSIWNILKSQTVDKSKVFIEWLQILTNLEILQKAHQEVKKKKKTLSQALLI